MAKKKTTKSTKIKSINKIDKDSLLSKPKANNIETDQPNVSNTEQVAADYYDDNLEFLNEEVISDHIPEEPVEPKQANAKVQEEIIQEPQVPNTQQVPKNNDIENENIILKKEVIRLQTLVSNLQEENNKLKTNFESNQKQLIDKLKEKQEDAKQQLEARLEKLEADKASEIADRQDAIFAEVVTTMLEPFLLFEKTVEQPIENELVRNYVEGYRMIIGMFKEAFNNLNIEQIVVNPGDEFNPAFMEAFDTEQNPNFGPNKVTKIISKGFVYKGKVIKFTVVVVNK